MSKILQDNFWKSNFGNLYTKRNNKKILIKSLSIHFKEVLSSMLGNNIKNVFEFGTNRGLNLDIIKRLNKSVSTNGLEINKMAYKLASKKHNILHMSALDYKPEKKYDLVITRVFLIHIHPKNLDKIYQKIFKTSKKYIYIEEYFNPTPVGVKYRNNSNVLFKRDFAKELSKKYKLKLIKYGFNWSEDVKKPTLDNTNWFLFKK